MPNWITYEAWRSNIKPHAYTDISTRMWNNDKKSAHFSQIGLLSSITFLKSCATALRRYETEKEGAVSNIYHHGIQYSVTIHIRPFLLISGRRFLFGCCMCEWFLSFQNIDMKICSMSCTVWWHHVLYSLLFAINIEWNHHSSNLYVWCSCAEHGACITNVQCSMYDWWKIATDWQSGILCIAFHVAGIHNHESGKRAFLWFIVNNSHVVFEAPNNTQCSTHGMD